MTPEARLHRLNDRAALPPSPVLLCTAYCALVIVLPSLLLLNDTVYDYRFVLLIASSLALLVITRLTIHDWSEVGVTLKGVVPALKINLSIATVVAAISWAGYRYGLVPFRDQSFVWVFFVFYIFISSPLQELIFRGVAHHIAERLGFDTVRYILFSASTYAYIHVIYRSWQTVVATAIIGAVWAWAYQRYPTLIGVTVSHAVVGVITIALGLI